MTPFNLEAANIDPNRVICRNGMKPSEWHHLPTAKTRERIIAVIDTYTFTYDEYGRLSGQEPGEESDYDLFMGDPPAEITDAECDAWLELVGILLGAYTRDAWPYLRDCARHAIRRERELIAQNALR